MAVNSQADFIKSFGRFGDNFLAHLSEDERVLPPEGVLPESLDRDIDISMKALGLDPDRYTVGSEANSINPVTGQPEFFPWIQAGIAAANIAKGFLKKDKDPTKKTRAALQNLMPQFQAFESTPGMYQDPYGAARWDRGGVSAMFSPRRQQIFGGWDDLRNQTYGRRAERGAEMERLFGGGPFQGEVDEQLRIGMEQEGRNVDSATSNALSKLFNVGGMSTGTAMQAGELQRRQAGTLADLKANRLKNWLKFRGGYEGDIRGFETDIKGYGGEQRAMVEALRYGIEPAVVQSKFDTSLDWDKLIQKARLSGAVGQYEDQKRMGQRSFMDRLWGGVDTVTGLYTGAGGGFGKLFGGGGGQSGGTVGQSTTFGPGGYSYNQVPTEYY
jgi:hypothetical protein